VDELSDVLPFLHRDLPPPPAMFPVCWNEAVSPSRDLGMGVTERSFERRRGRHGRRNFSHFPAGEGCDARRQIHSLLAMRSPATTMPSASICSTLCPRRTSTPRSRACFSRSEALARTSLAHAAPCRREQSAAELDRCVGTSDRSVSLPSQRKLGHSTRLEPPTTGLKSRLTGRPVRSAAQECLQAFERLARRQPRRLRWPRRSRGLRCLMAELADDGKTTLRSEFDASIQLPADCSRRHGAGCARDVRARAFRRG